MYDLYRNGAGNMCAVRVQTQPLTAAQRYFNGKISSGYDSNFNALEEAVTFEGRAGKFGYWVYGT